MAILIDPNTPQAKEAAKWEQHHTQHTIGSQPGHPYVYREYPRMLFKAARLSNGKWAVAEPEPRPFGFRDANEYDRACMEARAFTSSCQCEVRDDAEKKARTESGEGWRESASEALAWREALEKEISTAAAESAYQDRNMGEQARAERAKFEREKSEAGILGHTPEIPDSKKRRQQLSAT